MHTPRDSGPRPRFYTVRETAQMMRVSSMTIYRAIENDGFPAVRIRGRLVIPAHAIERMSDAAVTEHTTVHPADYAVRPGAERQPTPTDPLRCDRGGADEISRPPRQW